MTTIQPTGTCTAMVTHTGKLMPPPGGMQTGGPYVPCGQPVAEVGPCSGTATWVCGMPRDHAVHNDTTPPTHHPYQGRLVHVAPIGLCADCEHPKEYHGHDGWCGGCGKGYECEYVPGYEERELGHEAQR